ncbi:hypothetical protein ACFVW5_30025 [Streptomyces sp. NPDC058232]|uniref:hypothetical protein n=1 Tax=Streptomyces sp. NPDC058232 TaxID=3346393 RepID=UPI0036EB9B00
MPGVLEVGADVDDELPRVLGRGQVVIDDSEKSLPRKLSPKYLGEDRRPSRRRYSG